jgi:hypothetical protein
MNSDADAQIGADGRGFEGPSTRALPGAGTGTGASPADDGNFGPLADMLAELQHVLGLAGVAANVANAMIDPKAAMPSPDLLVEFAPRPTPELLEIKTNMNTLAKGKALSGAYQKFLNRLRATDSGTSGTLDFSRNSYGVPTRNLANIAAALQAACKTGLDVMNEIEAMAEAVKLDNSTSKEWSAIRQMLRDGCDGKHGLVKKDGTVDLPEWLVSGAQERRVEKRMKRRAQVVTLLNSAGQQSVTLRDMTSLGLAIEGVFGVAAGDEVVLRLATGEESPGTIRWYKDGRAGIQLAQELVERLRA